MDPYDKTTTIKFLISLLVGRQSGAATGSNKPRTAPLRLRHQRSWPHVFVFWVKVAFDVELLREQIGVLNLAYAEHAPFLLSPDTSRYKGA